MMFFAELIGAGLFRAVEIRTQTICQAVSPIPLTSAPLEQKRALASLDLYEGLS